MFLHPEKYPQQVFRGIFTGINSLTNHIEVELDLGFELVHRVSGTFFNLDLPRDNPMDPDCSESHAATAMQSRVCQLVQDKPVLVLSSRKVIFKPMPVEYGFSIFYYAEDRQSNWHSLENQLVREGHATWLDTSLPVPVLE